VFKYIRLHNLLNIWGLFSMSSYASTHSLSEMVFKLINSIPVVLLKHTFKDTSLCIQLRANDLSVNAFTFLWSLQHLKKIYFSLFLYGVALHLLTRVDKKLPNEKGWFIHFLTWWTLTKKTGAISDFLNHLQSAQCIILCIYVLYWQDLHCSYVYTDEVKLAMCGQ